MESGMYDENGRWLFINRPSGNSKPMGTSLLGHPVIPHIHGQVDKYKIPVRNKRNQMHIFKDFEDQSDTNHDSWTRYLIEQEPSLILDQAEGDGCCCCCCCCGGAEREKRRTLQGHTQIDLAPDTP
jgi:hypothetical protein